MLWDYRRAWCAVPLRWWNHKTTSSWLLCVITIIVIISIA